MPASHREPQRVPHRGKATSLQNRELFRRKKHHLPELSRLHSRATVTRTRPRDTEDSGGEAVPLLGGFPRLVCIRV